MNEIWERFMQRITHPAPPSVGTVVLTCDSIPPLGTVFLHGQTLQRSDYPDLWAWVEQADGVNQGFGEGDGRTTFTVPDLRGDFIAGPTREAPRAPSVTVHWAITT